MLRIFKDSALAARFAVAIAVSLAFSSQMRPISLDYTLSISILDKGVDNMRNIKLTVSHERINGIEVIDFGNTQWVTGRVEVSGFVFVLWNYRNTLSVYFLYGITLCCYTPPALEVATHESWHLGQLA